MSKLWRKIGWERFQEQEQGRSLSHFWLFFGTGWKWVMYLITCTHVHVLPVRMDTIRDIWGLLFDRHQKVQRTPIESCHDILTLHSPYAFLYVIFFFPKDNEQDIRIIDRSRHEIQVKHLNTYIKKIKTFIFTSILSI